MRRNDQRLRLRRAVLNSLSLLKFVLFLEKQFGVVVGSDELIPENFETIVAVCPYLRAKQGT